MSDFTSGNKSKKPIYTYYAQLKRVIDGDTYELLVDVGFGIHYTVRVRIGKVSTPKIFGDSAEDGLKVARYVQELFENAEEVMIETQYIRSFERYQADVYLDGENLAEHLYNKGYATLSDE